MSVDTLCSDEGDYLWDVKTDSPKETRDELDKDPANGAGNARRGSRLSFSVLGTSTDPFSRRVLSPALMDSLRNFFPYSLTGKKWKCC